MTYKKLNKDQLETLRKLSFGRYGQCFFEIGDNNLIIEVLNRFPDFLE